MKTYIKNPFNVETHFLSLFENVTANKEKVVAFVS